MDDFAIRFASDFGPAIIPALVAKLDTFHPKCEQTGQRLSNGFPAWFPAEAAIRHGTSQRRNHLIQRGAHQQEI
jgi:hypothetical protein